MEPLCEREENTVIGSTTEMKWEEFVLCKVQVLLFALTGLSYRIIHLACSG